MTLFWTSGSVYLLSFYLSVKFTAILVRNHGDGPGTVLRRSPSTSPSPEQGQLCRHAPERYTLPVHQSPQWWGLCIFPRESNPLPHSHTKFFPGPTPNLPCHKCSQLCPVVSSRDLENMLPCTPHGFSFSYWKTSDMFSMDFSSKHPRFLKYSHTDSVF